MVDTEMNAVAVIERNGAGLVPVDQFMPTMSLELATNRYHALVHFYKELMKADKDYGIIPGSDKPTLLKPGAEKLCTFFGLTVADPEFVDSIKDWTGKIHGEPFFYFEVRQRLMRNGEVIASQVGSANSMESKHRYRWVKAQDVPAGMDLSKLRTRDGSISEFTFAVDKAETGGKYGKPAEYWKAFKDAIANGTAQKVKKSAKGGKEYDAWQIGCVVYRVPNPDIADLVNTLQKMAQKRAFIGACLIAVNASEFFTQDLDDFDVDEPAPRHESTPQKSAPKTADEGQLAEQEYSGGDEYGDPETAAPAVKYCTPQEVQTLYELLRKAQVEPAKFCQSFKIGDVAELPQAWLERATKKLNATIKANAAKGPPKSKEEISADVRNGLMKRVKDAHSIEELAEVVKLLEAAQKVGSINPADVDAVQFARNKSEAALKGVLSKGQQEMLMGLIIDGGESPDTFCEFFGVPSIEAFPASRFQEACNRLKKPVGAK